MSKTRVFIYGSCVSRDTFEHFDRDQFELVQYVARQSALSAYTRPVSLVEPPTLSSPFQQRMVAGDYASSLQALIPEAASRTDLVLVDLVDERLGAYVLPDGSVVTRSTELIESGAEQQLPPGTQHLPFGSEQHLQYWSSGIAAVGELIRRHMPRAAVVLLDIPWAERSETGLPAPDSFGVGAQEANPVFRAYSQVAARALGAQVVTVDPGRVTSSPAHPWGEAPFHYSTSVYHDVVRQVTGADPQAPVRRSVTATAAPRRTAGARPADGRDAELPVGPNFLVAGVQRAGTAWLETQLRAHPDVFMAPAATRHFFSGERTKEARERYVASFRKGANAKFRGERTPTYLRVSAPKNPWSVKSKADAATAAHEHLSPDAQVLVVLRNPVARAISAYWRFVQEAKIDADLGIFRAPPALGVIDLGLYHRHLAHWRSVFGQDRVHVLLYDDLVADPAKFLTSALDALGIPTGVQAYWDGLKLKQRVNPTPPWLTAFRKKHPVNPQELGMLATLYRDDVAYVEDLLGRNLPEWRKHDPR